MICNKCFVALITNKGLLLCVPALVSDEFSTTTESFTAHTTNVRYVCAFVPAELVTCNQCFVTLVTNKSLLISVPALVSYEFSTTAEIFTAHTTNIRLLASM